MSLDPGILTPLKNEKATKAILPEEVIGLAEKGGKHAERSTWSLEEGNEDATRHRTTSEGASVKSRSMGLMETVVNWEGGCYERRDESRYRQKAAVDRVVIIAYWNLWHKTRNGGSAHLTRKTQLGPD